MRACTIVATIALAVGASAAHAQTASAPGPLVDVGGHRPFLRCTGSERAGPTVLLEAGGGGSSREWSAVQDLVAPHARVCSYDRAGLGASEPGPAPRTMHQSHILYNVPLARWVRMRELATGRAIPEPRRDGPATTTPDPRDDYTGDEFAHIYRARQANPQPLGDRPLVVLPAGNGTRLTP